MTDKKTKPCPTCGKELTLPVEYLNAMKSLRAEVEAFRQVILADAVMDNDKPILDDYIMQAVSDCLNGIDVVDYKHHRWVVKGHWKDGWICIEIKSDKWRVGNVIKL